MNEAKIDAKMTRKKNIYLSVKTIRGQTVHWIGAQVCNCMLLDSRDNSVNMLQKVCGLLKNFRGFRV